MARKSVTKEPVKASPPNLPQHNLPEPFAKLQTLGYGDHKNVFDSVATQLTNSGAEAGAERLLAMILDETYYDYDGDTYEGGEDGDPRGWTSLNALRVLSLMGEAGKVGIMPMIGLLGYDDEYIAEELPFYFAAMGVDSFKPLLEKLFEESEDIQPQLEAIDALSEIAQKHESMKEETVAVFEKIVRSTDCSAEMVGFAIIGLLDLGSVESYPLIEEAFKQERVDLECVQLGDVQEHFGLEITAKRVIYNFDGSILEPNWDEFELPSEMLYSNEEDSDITEEEPAQIPFVNETKVGRNEPCPCGSGKKYKKCCGSASD